MLNATVRGALLMKVNLLVMEKIVGHPKWPVDRLGPLPADEGKFQCAQNKLEFYCSAQAWFPG